jgi:uncharacterized DUF497 family protein
MRTDDFEWDDAKAVANYARHGVTFAMASDVFDDPFAIIEVDDRRDYAEDRYSVIGMVEGHLLFVAYTLRGDRIRIISARLAEPYERRQYHEKSR